MVVNVHAAGDYKLHPCNLPFGQHKTRSIFLLEKLVPCFALNDALVKISPKLITKKDLLCALCVSAVKSFLINLARMQRPAILKILRLYLPATSPVSKTCPLQHKSVQRHSLCVEQRAQNHEHPGCGIGLSIVMQVVELHGAKLHMDNPETGSGLKVTVCFPNK